MNKFTILLFTLLFTTVSFSQEVKAYKIYNSKGKDIGNVIAFALIQRVAAKKNTYYFFNLLIGVLFVLIIIYIFF